MSKSKAPKIDFNLSIRKKKQIGKDNIVNFEVFQQADFLTSLYFTCCILQAKALVIFNNVRIKSR